MVIKRSSSAEVTRQIDALLASDPLAREAAAARLAILGPRALERLGATLHGLRNEAQVLAVLDVMERIGDPRSAFTVEPLLRDQREAIVTAALAIIRRALQAEDAASAAHATDVLVEIAIDRSRPDSVRGAALDALDDLPDDVVAPLRRTLSMPPKVDRTSRGTPKTVPREAPQARLASWVEADSAAMPLDEARQTIIAAAAAPLALLHRLVERIRVLEGRATGEEALGWRNVRGLVHQLLAERHSRVALYDLRETLERTPEELTVTMIAALSALGDASCLEPVADAWATAHDPWLKAQLGDVFQTIVRRESLTRRHAVLKRIAARHPGLAAVVSTPSQTRPLPPRDRRT